MWANWLFIIPLLYLSYTDTKSFTLSDKVVYPLALVAFSTAGIRDIGYVNSLEAGGIGLGMLLLMALLTRGNTALGDAKLAACIGLIIGVSPTLYALWVAFASLTVYGWIRHIPKTFFVPLAPFFCFGLFAGLLVLTY